MVSLRNAFDKDCLFSNDKSSKACVNLKLTFCLLKTRHQVLLNHCVVYYINRYQLWKILNGAHIESLDVEDSNTGTKIIEKKEKTIFNVLCVMRNLAYVFFHVSCVMCHGSPVTCNLTTTLCSFSSCRRFHFIVSFWFEKFWEEPPKGESAKMHLPKYLEMTKRLELGSLF